MMMVTHIGKICRSWLGGILLCASSMSASFAQDVQNPPDQNNVSSEQDEQEASEQAKSEEVTAVNQTDNDQLPSQNSVGQGTTVQPMFPNGQPMGGAPQPGQRRRRRTIQNREFDDRDKIILLLNAHCDFPTKEDLLSTSPDVEEHLQSILEDESLLFSVRMGALEALAYFVTPANRETLEEILKNPNDAEHQQKVTRAIRAYAKMAPEDAPAVIAPFLASEVDLYRFIAIASLRDCPGEAALKVLKDRYEVEKNRYFQTRLKQAIENHCRKDTYCVQAR